jgi:hypothetical protein
VATYFKVKKQWDESLDQWNVEGKVIIGSKQYYELLFLVKSASEVDHIWFSFFEGMHRHAAIVTVSQFLSVLNSNISPTNLNWDHSLWKILEIKILSLSRSPTLQFLTIWTRSCHKKIDTPMFQSQFHLSAYVPKQTMNAGDLIEATRLQSS